MRQNNFLEFGPNVLSIASSLRCEQLHNPNREVMCMAVYPSFAAQLGNSMVFFILYGKEFFGRIPGSYWFHIWSHISCSPKTLLVQEVSDIQGKLLNVMFTSTKESYGVFCLPSSLPPFFLNCFTLCWHVTESTNITYETSSGTIVGFGDFFFALCYFGIVWQICIFYQGSFSKFWVEWIMSCVCKYQ